MALKFNGTEISTHGENVVFNGKKLDIVNFNGTEVWHRQTNIVTTTESMPYTGKTYTIGINGGNHSETDLSYNFTLSNTPTEVTGVSASGNGVRCSRRGGGKTFCSGVATPTVSSYSVSGKTVTVNLHASIDLNYSGDSAPAASPILIKVSYKYVGDWKNV